MLELHRKYGLFKLAAERGKVPYAELHQDHLYEYRQI